MTKKIVFLITGHFSKDERVYYHQAKSLAQVGYKIHIISTKEVFTDLDSNICINSYNDDGLSQNDKINKMVECVNIILPDIIICDSPLSVIASNLYKKKRKVIIIYDITEWYPSKKNLRNQNFFGVIFKFIALNILNLLAGFKTDKLIFGEYYKSIPFRILFFWKQHIYLSYYPDLNYIQYYPLKKIENQIDILYSGLMTKDKGIDSIFKALNLASDKLQDIQFNLHIIGIFPSESNFQHYKNLCLKLNENFHVIFEHKLPFLEYCKVIGNTHLFFDLREIDLENTYCLPIKLFYYLACGRPMIYSNLKAIRKEVKNINFGYLCDPTDFESIANQIIEYIVKPELYIEHANNALELSHSVYNWNKIKNDFNSFIDRK